MSNVPWAFSAPPHKRAGLNRIEVITLLALCGLALQLLPTLLIQGREAGRRQQCCDNMRELVKAMMSYETSTGSLPVAANWTTEGLEIAQIYDPNSGMEWWPNITAVPPGTYADTTYSNWILEILPHAVAELNNVFDPSAPISHPRNEKVRTWEFPLARCPDDQYNNSQNHFLRTLADGGRSSHARGNYALNGGTHRDCQIPGSSADPCTDGFHYSFDSSSNEFQWWGSGVAGINKAFSLGDFPNGSGRIVAIEEVRAGLHPKDPRGVWALGQIGGSITWAHGINGDASLPNHAAPNSDDIAGCRDLIIEVGRDLLNQERMGCCSHCLGNVQATARSMHQGGVYVLMLDGASRFIANDVDPTIWHLLHSRDTPPTVLSAQKHGSSTLPTFADSVVPAVQTIKNSLDMEFNLIPAGSFTMGLPDEGYSVAKAPEVGPHEVRLTRDFYLGVHEVTQQQYEQITGENPSWHRGDTRLPVESVSWYDAVSFCDRLSRVTTEASAGRSYRLPTEAEWEYCCRSGKREPYRFSHKRSSDDLSGDNGGHMREPIPITKVGSYPANSFGLFDLRGNVFEWTADWYKRDYYSSSPCEDPRGPERGYFKIFRGSDWIFAGDKCLLHRYPAVPWSGHRYVGFRVVCELTVQN